MGHAPFNIFRVAMESWPAGHAPTEATDLFRSFGPRLFEDANEGDDIHAQSSVVQLDDTCPACIHDQDRHETDHV